MRMHSDEFVRLLRDDCSDSPFSLVTAALQSIPVLSGTQKTGFDFTLYTGDLVSHDSENQLSRYCSSYSITLWRAADAFISYRDYILYTETLVYDLFKRLLGTGPVYAALGNHDSYNQSGSLIFNRRVTEIYDVLTGRKTLLTLLTVLSRSNSAGMYLTQPG